MQGLYPNYKLSSVFVVFTSSRDTCIVNEKYRSIIRLFLLVILIKAEWKRCIERTYH